MKYHVRPTKKFQKDLKRAQRRGYGESLPEKNRDHLLTGNFNGCRECHITPDWLLVYEIYEEELLLYLTRTGTHSDLFS